MPTSIYDSRAFVKKLTNSGMPEGQADTLANENLLLLAEHLATKDDYRALETSLRSELVTTTELHTALAAMVTQDQLKAELASIRLELAEVRADLTGGLKEMRADLTGELKKMRADLTGELKETRADLTGELMETRADLTGELKEMRANSTGELMETRADFSSVRADLGILRADVSSLENRLLIKLGGLMVAILTLFRLL